MNHDTTAFAFSALTSDFLRNSDCLIDNLFADLWQASPDEGALAVLRLSQALWRRGQRCAVLPDDVGLVEIELREPVRQGFTAYVLRRRQRCSV